MPKRPLYLGLRRDRPISTSPDLPDVTPYERIELLDPLQSDKTYVLVLTADQATQLGAQLIRDGMTLQGRRTLRVVPSALNVS